MSFKASKVPVPDNNPFEHDKLGAKKHVENISLLLKNASSPLVFSINAPWGYGKTTFLEMLNADLKSAGNKAVFFSAWETDFVTDPLQAFLGEIDKSIESLLGSDEKKRKLWDKTKKAGLNIIKNSVTASIKTATHGVIDVGNIMDNTVEEYSKHKQVITDFKENLTALFKIDSDPSRLYIFIDELDRCRPTYAIELLERIKHLFEVEGLIFILAMDKVQLSHSIKSVYGNQFEATGYLRRFIDIEYNLPKNSLGDFITHLYKTFNFDSFFEKRKDTRHFNHDARHLIDAFKLLAESKNLSLREVEQLFAKVNLVLLSTKEYIELYPSLLVFLIIVKEFHTNIYDDYINESSTPEAIIRLFYEMIPEELRHSSSECALIEAFLITVKRDVGINNIEISLRPHIEIVESIDSSGNQKDYSHKMHKIHSSMLEEGLGYRDLKSLASRIAMLENFNFHEAN